jgi:hypothetical protein
MVRAATSLPEELAAELDRRAEAEGRSTSSLVRLAVRQLLFGSGDGAVLGRGWRLEEDWRGLWAVREKAPGVWERVLLEAGPAAVVDRPVASMQVAE